MNIQVQISKSSTHYNWIVTPDAYLATSLLLCRSIPSSQFPQDVVMENDIFTSLGFRSGHPNYELIYPIIFCLKHGIELYLKGLGNIDHGEYINEHDLKELFMFSLQKSRNNKNNRSLLFQLHKETWPIIEKYYYGTYIPGRKGKSSPDKKNEAERYPEARKRTYKISETYSWVTKDLLNQIEKDIKYLESKFAEAKRNIQPTKRFIYGRKRK